MVHARIQRVVYGATDPRAGAAGSVFNIVQSPALNHRVAVEGGVLADDCSKLLRDFFAVRR
jgi:tRNA(adenine34) deaminase